jgi:hypothetical protein
LDDVVFLVAATAYTWEDVLDWGRRQEAWGDHVREVREGVAALALARWRGDDLDREAAAAAAAFRRRHRLISAEDTERWLAERHLTVAGWKDHIRRTVARDRYRGDVAGLTPEARDEAARRWATGVCTGLYAGFAEALAERAAAAAADAEAEGAPSGAPPGGGADRWDGLEAAYQAFRHAAATERAVADEVAARRLDWIGFELEWLSFAEEATAREALLCLREDGDFSAALPDPPATAGLERRRAHLCDFEPELRPALLGAQAGDALGPARTDQGWRVTRVVARTVPADSDEDVRRRAVTAVADRAVRCEVERRVRWRERH